MSRKEELVQLIANADKMYWETGKGPVEDSTYDRWVEELKTLDPKYLLSFGTPRILSNGKLKHPIPMLSMNKCYDIEHILAWMKKYAKGCYIEVMPKYDGIALCKYKNGTVGTRGDGTVGEDVTQVTLPFMKEEAPGLGEAVILNSEFEKMKDLGYQHPRNAVSGILGSLDPALQERAKHITFARYNDQRYMVELNADTCTKELIETAIFNLSDKKYGMAKNFPMDGIVFKMYMRKDTGEKNYDCFYRLGHTAHHWRGQIAYKFKKPGVPSIIREVFFQEKNGTITPMVRFDPVFCDGAYLSKASCSNWDKVKEWDIRVGDACEVERAGGVIPYLLKTSHTENSQEAVQPPTHCPTCGTELIKSGKRLYCPKCDK